MRNETYFQGHTVSKAEQPLIDRKQRLRTEKELESRSETVNIKSLFRFISIRFS